MHYPTPIRSPIPQRFRLRSGGPNHVFFATLLALCAFVLPASAFNAPEDTAGSLKARIDGPTVVTQTDTPLPVKVIIENAGDADARGTARMAVIDQWRVEPADSKPFSVAPKATAQLEFSVVAGKGSYNALYPIHAYVEAVVGSTKIQLHPILILDTQLPDPPKPDVPTAWRTLDVAADSALGLWHAELARTVIAVFGEKPTVSPPGWQGSDGRTRCSVAFGQPVERGGSRPSIAIHPPWYSGLAGMALVEFPLRLANQTPITLRFANAIRDTHPEFNEPPSDGVTFRVRAVPLDAPDGAIGDVLFELHTDAKQWQNAEVDLSRFAGQAIRLQLESHPGPKNDTTCDQSYWGAPTLAVGAPQTQHAKPSGLPRDIGKAGDYAISVTPGPRGLLDAEVRFTHAEKQLVFHGFHVQVAGDALESPSSLCPLAKITDESGNGRCRVRHQFRLPATWPEPAAFDLLADLWAEDGALKTRFWIENAPAPRPWRVVYLEDVAAGAWNQPLKRVYAGVGNVLEGPKAFTLGFDGHQLASSFVGFDFANGASLVQACDVPPDRLEVAPEASVATLHAPHAQTVCYIPAANVWGAVKTYRVIDKRQPAGGVKVAAGRFVFDLWGGSYAKSAEQLGHAFRYGLTDSMVMWHCWQRWGYDYRLPDIFPPVPNLGTLDEFRALADACEQHGVVFAPHDNYIDFYPDADGYSYEDIAFLSDRTPIRGWLNEGRKAQSYRWRPDRVRPFVERNLGLIRQAFAPTGYFIDVWSSIGPHDYWTQDGQFFDRTFTRNTWGETFAWIRESLGNDAPQISESGHDQLIGWLDGAQCNHLRVDPRPNTWCTWHVACLDSERIPWLDAAHHDRFILHGAGYSTRYEGTLDPLLHGIYSDDYIASEVLTGHPAMVEGPFGRDVVRKYWLLHDLARALALRRIESVEFVENDLHRQHVLWSGGANVWVNRGKNDWPVQGRTLPQYGFYAEAPLESGGTAAAAIERLDGVIVDWSRSPDQLYVNARPLGSDQVPASASVDSIRWLGDRTFEVNLEWTAVRPLAEPLTVFVHLMNDKGEIKFQGDHKPPTPTTQWQGRVKTSAKVRIPDPYAPGQSFELRVGLYNVQTGARARLEGENSADRSIRLGALRLDGDATGLTGITWTPLARDQEPESLVARLNPEGKAIHFGPVTTDGACRLTREGNTLTVTALPEGRPFSLRIVWAELPWNLPKPQNIEALTEDGAVLRRTSVKADDGAIQLNFETSSFANRVAQ